MSKWTFTKWQRPLAQNHVAENTAQMGNWHRWRIAGRSFGKWCFTRGLGFHNWAFNAGLGFTKWGFVKWCSNPGLESITGHLTLGFNRWGSTVEVQPLGFNNWRFSPASGFNHLTKWFNPGVGLDALQYKWG